MSHLSSDRPIVPGSSLAPGDGQSFRPSVPPVPLRDDAGTMGRDGNSNIVPASSLTDCSPQGANGWRHALGTEALFAPGTEGQFRCSSCETLRVRWQRRVEILSSQPRPYYRRNPHIPIPCRQSMLVSCCNIWMQCGGIHVHSVMS